MARTVTMRQVACHDWRAVPDATIESLFAAERWRWESLLDWELGAAWDELRRGRELQTVSGLVALAPDGQATGWTYYLVHDGAVQIGAFSSASESTTAMLLDAILADVRTTPANRVTLFAFTDAPGLVADFGLADLPWTATSTCAATSLVRVAQAPATCGCGACSTRMRQPIYWAVPSRHVMCHVRSHRAELPRNGGSTSSVL